MICCRYGEFRLIDIPHLREVMPLTMENFYKNIKQSSKAASEKLRYQWLPEVCEIVDNHRETVEEWMPQDSVSHHSRSWNSVQPNSECFHFLNALSDGQNFKWRIHFILGASLDIDSCTFNKTKTSILILVKWTNARST